MPTSFTVRTSPTAGLFASCLLAGLLCALPLSSAAQEEQPTVKMLISSLENCQSWEPYCVRILRRNFLGQGVVDVKAQIRGGRIFWYRVNRRSGEVVRLN